MMCSPVAPQESDCNSFANILRLSPVCYKEIIFIFKEICV